MSSTERAQEIEDDLIFFDAWEDKYRYIIDLGKTLPEFDANKRDDEHLVRGCQSQVWIDADLQSGNLNLSVDSDAFIVKGLLAVVLAAYQGLTPKQALDFDVDGYFNRLELITHLSPTRGNGLRAMVSKIREIAVTALS
ncbi:MAG: SufE family protein [Halieaceae bacterium]|nr:SufE family protein [Halieaceae bacterium]